MLYKLLRLTIILFAPLFALLFGCSPSTVIDTEKMVSTYMAPVVLKINGKVMDSISSNAITNIRVSLLSGSYTNSVTNTAPDGTYSISNQIYAGTVTLQADDIDGASNGGVYQPESANIDLNSDITTNIDIYLHH